MALGLKIGKCSLQGVRARNDDILRVYRTDLFQLVQLADGWVVLDEQGAWAAERAIQVIERELTRRIKPAAPLAETARLVHGAVVQANEVLRALVRLQGRPNYPFAAALVLGLWSGEHMHIYGVGNCLAYLVRPGVVASLNPDHSIFGFIRSVEQEDDPYPGLALTHYLGGMLDGEAEVKSFPCETRDRFVFCTDGLHFDVGRESIVTHLRTEIDVQRCAERLCQQALDNGTRDNVSCIVVEVVQTAD